MKSTSVPPSPRGTVDLVTEALSLQSTNLKNDPCAVFDAPTIVLPDPIALKSTPMKSTEPPRALLGVNKIVGMVPSSADAVLRQRNIPVHDMLCPTAANDAVVLLSST